MTTIRVPRPRQESDAASEELIVGNLPLVGYLVAEIAGRLPAHVDLDDLRSAGFVALVQAARSFDPNRGVPFNRFASTRIRGAMIDELRSHDWASRSVRAKARRIEAAQDELAAVLGRKPTRAELAERLGTTVAALDDFDDDLHRSTVLSLHGFDGTTTVEEMVIGREDSPETTMVQRERTAYLRDAVVELPERLRRVVIGLYFEDATIPDLAAELGVTESRISQMRTQALGLLRDGMNSALDPDLVTDDERPGGCVARRRESYFAAIASRSSFTDRVSTAARASIPAASQVG